MQVITEVGLVGAGVRFQTPGSRRLRVSATRVVQPLDSRRGYRWTVCVDFYFILYFKWGFCGGAGNWWM